MRRSNAPVATVILPIALGMAACGLAPDTDEFQAPPFEAAHALVITYDDRADTLAFELRPQWRKVPAGADTVFGFAQVPATAEWTAYGRVEGDSLVWGLTRLVGDMGVTLEMRGRLTPEGVSGCGGFVRRGYADRQTGTAAAFMLVPVDRPEPNAAAVPVARCREV